MQEPLQSCKDLRREPLWPYFGVPFHGEKVLEGERAGWGAQQGKPQAADPCCLPLQDSLHRVSNWVSLWLPGVTRSWQTAHMVPDGLFFFYCSQSHWFCWTFLLASSLFWCLQWSRNRAHFHPPWSRSLLDRLSLGKCGHLT